MVSILFICLILWSASPAKCSNTQLIVKKGSKFDECISTDAETFIDLVKQSRVFVDNTLLIIDILKKPLKTSSWIAPSKWGKSVNLHMIKTFFEKQFDDNGTVIWRESTPGYRLFVNNEILQDDGSVQQFERPLLIGKHQDLVKSNYASSPVIHISFKHATGADSKEIKNQIQLAISAAFQQHKYIIRKFEANYFERAKELKKFHEYLNGTNWKDIKGAIPLLCRALSSDVVNEDNSVVILIEDYDAPITNYLRNDYVLDDDLNDIFRFLIDLIPYTFNNKYIDKCMRFAIVAGKFKIEHHEYDEDFYIIDKEDTLSEYFGFIQENVQQLFARYDVNTALSRQAFQWYGGFESLISKKEFCNPLSIAKFVKTKRLDYYFREKTDDFLTKLLYAQPQFINSLLSLLSQQEVSIEKSVQLKFQCRPSFKDVLCDTERSDKNATLQEIKFFTYLMGEGLLSKTCYPDEARLANSETAAFITEQLIEYYRKEYSIKQNFLRNAAVGLRDIIRSNDTKTMLLEDPLAVLYHNIFTRSRKTRSIKAINAIFTCIALRMQEISKFLIDAHYFTMTETSNVIAVDKKTSQGAVFEITYNSLAEDAFQLAKKHENTMATSNKINTVKLIGINIMPNGTVQAIAKYVTKIQPKNETSASIE